LSFVLRCAVVWCNNFVSVCRLASPGGLFLELLVICCAECGIGLVDSSLFVVVLMVLLVVVCYHFFVLAGGGVMNTVRFP
jgi:hypothetical protein